MTSNFYTVLTPTLAAIDGAIKRALLHFWVSALREQIHLARD